MQNQFYFSDHVPQDELVHHLVSLLRAMPGVEGIIQRGSYAKGAVDRASDLDFLVVVVDQSLNDFLNSYLERLNVACTVLHSEGWLDTIVPDFGGLGIVYLVERDGKLIQLDFYITAASGANRILNFPTKYILFQSERLAALRSEGTELSSTAKNAFAAFKSSVHTEFQCLLEVAILYQIYAKYIYRRNATLALKYRYALIESIAVLIRSVYTPGREDYKMYDWNSDFHSINSPLVRMFERNIELIDIYSERQLHDLGRVIKILYFESSLATQFPQFEIIFNKVEAYADNLLNPSYTSATLK